MVLWYGVKDEKKCQRDRRAMISYETVFNICYFWVIFSWEKPMQSHSPTQKVCWRSEGSFMQNGCAFRKSRACDCPTFLLPFLFPLHTPLSKLNIITPLWVQHFTAGFNLDYGEEVHWLVKNFSQRRGYLRQRLVWRARRRNRKLKTLNLECSGGQVSFPGVQGCPRNLTCRESP